MKKIGVYVLLFLMLFSFVVAEDNVTGNETADDFVENVSLEEDVVSFSEDESGKIDKAFFCLEEKVRGKCDSLSVEEISFVILSSPSSDVLEECRNALVAKQDSSSCWPSGDCNIKDTALAVLALNHLQEDVSMSENWLLSKNRTATEIIWYLQQDSNQAAQCKVSYGSKDYLINVDDNKKLDSGVSPCLKLAQSNYWLQVSPDCYDYEYSVSCDKEFIATMLYKHQSSRTIFVLPDTQSASATGTIKLKINAQCFGLSSCDYESSLWATLALLEAGKDIEIFLPYLVALADMNKRYVSNAFLYMITNYEDYATQLIEDQSLGNLWEESGNKFYDTALALLSLQKTTSELVVKARNKIFFFQLSDGCWETAESIRDIAVLLWALEGRVPSIGASSGNVDCSEAGFFCIPSSECPAGQQLNNYWCSGLSSSCCQTENLKSCDEYFGEECVSGYSCVGNERRSTDSDYCCVGSCEEVQVVSECQEFGGVCRDSPCSDSQELIYYSCDDSTQNCCKAKDVSVSSGWPWWLWLIIILIIILLAVLIFFFRDNIKLMWHKIRGKSKNGKDGNKGIGRPGFPPKPGFPPRPNMSQMRGRSPRPGFPPVRRRSPMSRPVRKSNNPIMRKKPVDNTFGKLKEMNK